MATWLVLSGIFVVVAMIGLWLLGSIMFTGTKDDPMNHQDRMQKPWQ